MADLPCCFEGCPNQADHGPALEVVRWNDHTFHAPTPEGCPIRPCVEHRTAIFDVIQTASLAVA